MRLAIAGCLAFALASPSSQDPQKERLKQALTDTDPEGPWVYDDVAAGFALARKSGKPMLVVFR